MPINLIDSVKSVFTDTVITKFSTLLGETESNTRKAVHGAIPMVLTAILQKAGSTPEAAAGINNMAKQAAASDFFGHIHELSISTGGLTAGSALLTKGTDYAKGLLTDRTDAVTKEISRYANISISSSSFITGVASFAALDSIGRHLANANLDIKGMVAWLATQRDSIIHAIPGGLQVKQALGIDHYPGEKVAKTTRRTSLFVILALIVILVILFFGYRSCNQSSATNTTTTDTLPPPPPPASASPVQDTLPNGSVITVDNGGTEDRLIGFLNDPNAKIDSKNGNWFDFTRVNFASKSPDLLLESETQLKNIVAILNAFPKAKIKIGGFSDNTGDSVDNVKLSQQRADNVLAKLKELGAKGSQLTGAKGYGPDMPIGDNGTEAGRALNRRMSIDVKDK